MSQRLPHSVKRYRLIVGGAFVDQYDEDAFTITFTDELATKDTADGRRIYSQMQGTHGEISISVDQGDDANLLFHGMLEAFRADGALYAVSVEDIQMGIVYRSNCSAVMKVADLAVGKESQAREYTIAIGEVVTEYF